MPFKNIFNFLFGSNTQDKNIVKNYSSVKIGKGVYIGGKPANSSCIDISDQPLSFKEIEIEHFSKISLSHFKFVFIQNNSLTKTKVSIEAPLNFIEHISIIDGEFGFNGINVIGNSKNLNTNITIEGKLPESIELSCSAIFTSLLLKNDTLSITTDTSASFNSLEVITDKLTLESSTSSKIEIKHLKPITEKLKANINCSTSSVLTVDYLYNSSSKIDLSTSGKFTAKHLINSRIKGVCSTSGTLFVDDLNVVDVDTSTSGKVKRI